MSTSDGELLEILVELREVWDELGIPTELSQPAARKDKKVTPQDVARMEIVLGLTRHVYETARAVQLLLDHDLPNAAVPHVRIMYECALTAVWIVQSKGDEATKAFLYKHAKQQAGTQRVLDNAVSTVFRGAKIANTNYSDFDGSVDSVRSFDKICEDLEPGGTDAYIVFRFLSPYCHASAQVVDMYFAKPPNDTDIPPSRSDPAVPVSRNLLLFFATASMVWSGRALTYLSKNATHRNMLRRVAKDLGIDPEPQVSDAYRNRHSQARRKNKAAGK